MKNVSRFVILDPLRKLRTHLKTNTKDASMKEQASVISDVYIRNIFQFQKIYYYFNFPTVPKEIPPKTQQYYDKVVCYLSNRFSNFTTSESKLDGIHLVTTETPLIPALLQESSDYSCRHIVEYAGQSPPPDLILPPPENQKNMYFVKLRPATGY